MSVNSKTLTHTLILVCMHYIEQNYTVIYMTYSSHWVSGIKFTIKCQCQQHMNKKKQKQNGKNWKKNATTHLGGLLYGNKKKKI